ncbi:MAG: hypothetical protein M3R67_04715, partial [Acidobacteriota bacterium]|nr:hypothetical protein [Acidobacteriota bacterium]
MDAGLVAHDGKPPNNPPLNRIAVHVMQTAEQSAVLEDVKLTAKRIFSLIAAELAQVEAEFERQARSNVQVIAYLGDYLREAGGKRVRPALTILSN